MTRTVVGRPRLPSTGERGPLTVENERMGRVGSPRSWILNLEVTENFLFQYSQGEGPWHVTGKGEHVRQPWLPPFRSHRCRRARHQTRVHTRSSFLCYNACGSRGHVVSYFSLNLRPTLPDRRRSVYVAIKTVETKVYLEIATLGSLFFKRQEVPVFPCHTDLL